MLTKSKRFKPLLATCLVAGAALTLVLWNWKSPLRAASDLPPSGGADPEASAAESVEATPFPNQERKDPERRPTDEPGNVNPEVAAAPDGSFVLQSLSDIKVLPGAETPSVGDTIYSITGLPQDVCGTFWVQSSDGTVAQLAVCNHADGEHPVSGEQPESGSPVGRRE